MPAQPPSTEDDRPSIIFMIPRLARGGMLSVLTDTWERLADHELAVIAMDASVTVRPPVTRIARSFGDPLRFPGSWIYAFRMWRAARRAIAARRGSVVLVPQDSLATGLAAVLAGRTTGVPVVVMDHGSAIVIRTPFFWRERVSRHRLSERLRLPFLQASVRLMHAVTCRLADVAFVPSRESADRFAADGIPRARIARYHVPLDIDRFHPREESERAEVRARLGVAPDELVVLVLGRLTPEKGIDTVVRAIAALPLDERPTLLVGGEGPLRQSLEKLAASLAISCRFLGSVDPGQLAPLYRAADVFAYASRQGTNVPVAILEAMASGLFVIGTNQPPAVPDMLAEGRGLVAAADDVAAYARALRQATVIGPDGRSRAGSAARSWVATHHAPGVLDGELRDMLSMVMRQVRR